MIRIEQLVKNSVGFFIYTIQNTIVTRIANYGFIYFNYPIKSDSDRKEIYRTAHRAYSNPTPNFTKLFVHVL